MTIWNTYGFKMNSNTAWENVSGRCQLSYCFTDSTPLTVLSFSFILSMSPRRLSLVQCHSLLVKYSRTSTAFHRRVWSRTNLQKIQITLIRNLLNPLISAMIYIYRIIYGLPWTTMFWDTSGLIHQQFCVTQLRVKIIGESPQYVSHWKKALPI